MSVRNSKAYGTVKAVNGLIFVALGGAIIFQLVTRIGLKMESVSGLALGAALIALGVYRAMGYVRSRR